MEMKLLEDIQRLGLNSYEAKIYLALLERDSLSVGEISKMSQVPRARAYDILDSLAADGLAVLKPGRYKRYSAAHPDSFRERLVSQNEKHSAELRKTIDSVTLTLKGKFESAINSGGRRFHPLEYIEIITNPYQTHKRFMELVAGAKKEILGFAKPPYSATGDMAKEEMEQQTDLCGREVVQLKSIHEIPSSKEEIQSKLEDLIRTTKGSDETRVIRELPMKMVVVDERFVMLPLEDPVSSGTSFTTQVVEHASLAKGLRILFYTLWEQAEDYHVLKDLIK